MFLAEYIFGSQPHFTTQTTYQTSIHPRSCVIEVTGRDTILNSWPHSLERPAALLNVSAVFGRVGQVEFEHVAEGEVGDAPHEAALGPERSHGQVLGVDGAA